MALSYTVNLIDGGDLSLSYETDGRILAKGTRIAEVFGMTDGSSDQSATALERALAIVRVDYPRWLSYSNTFRQCKVVGHQAMGQRQSDDACLIRIFYDTVPGPQGQATPWT